MNFGLSREEVANPQPMRDAIEKVEARLKAGESEGKIALCCTSCREALLYLKQERARRKKR